MLGNTLTTGRRLIIETAVVERSYKQKARDQRRYDILNTRTYIQNGPHDTSEEDFSKEDVKNTRTNDNVRGFWEKLQRYEHHLFLLLHVYACT
jgi:hypothetical protein